MTQALARASGSSSCAAVAAPVRLGLRDPGTVTAAMPAGTLEMGVDDGYAMPMFGPVGEVADGIIAQEILPWSLRVRPDVGIVERGTARTNG